MPAFSVGTLPDMLYHFEAAKELKTVKLDLIISDLDLALTLTQIARQASEKDRAKRSVHNARRGYDAALSYLNTSSLSAFEVQSLSRKLARLKSALISLGESFPFET